MLLHQRFRPIKPEVEVVTPCFGFSSRQIKTILVKYKRTPVFAFISFYFLAFFLVTKEPDETHLKRQTEPPASALWWFMAVTAAL